MNGKVITPGATICILGAGQLGKMSLMAAHRFGYHTMVWAPEGDNPAMEMATHRLISSYDDERVIDQILSKADVITTEWENIPLDLIEELELRGGVVRPGSLVLRVAQSRIKEKQMAWALDIPTTPTAWLPQNKDWQADWKACLPGILKTNTLGYDGKGQWCLSSEEEVLAAHKQAGVDCVLEKLVPLKTELSIMVARTSDVLQVSISDVVENKHTGGILDTTVWPLRDREITNEEFNKMRGYCNRIVDHLSLEGVLALEFFVDEKNNILFNEMAPRPHNSFHGSIEAAYTSQFEQHVRAICGLSHGRVNFHSPFQMTNLIGGNWDDWSEFSRDLGCFLHIYGKKVSCPGRKMGHLTRIYRPNA